MLHSFFQNLIWNLDLPIHLKDRYKTAFTVPFRQYEWIVMSFGLKNAPSEFQRIMNDIYTPLSEFCIVYIDDVLVFSQTIDQHFKHLKTLFLATKKASLAISSSVFKHKNFILYYTILPMLWYQYDQDRGVCVCVQKIKYFKDKIISNIKLVRGIVLPDQCRA